MKKTRTARRVRKLLVVVSCIALVLGIAIGGTIAWLTDDTDPVINTFTPAGIEISLTETPNDGDDWTAHLIPSKEYDKDPVVKVLDGEGQTDVDVYLFVEFDASTSKNYLDYTDNLNTTKGWNLVTGETDVWWRRVNVADSVKEWHLIEGDKVTVKTGLEEGGMPEDDVTMTYTAYAIQVEGFKTATNTDAVAAALAWAEIGK